MGEHNQCFTLIQSKGGKSYC
uniref:Uncharacterized protein n=1 Tax=Anguilla anguilla TaxID=7936 RepID=A0A0E9XNH3_ANGAN